MTDTRSSHYHAEGPKLVQCERCLFRVPEADMEDSCVCVDCAAYD